MIKRRVRNNLRYYAYWQTIKQIATDGILFEDYVNQGAIYCDKQGLQSIELFDPSTKRIESRYKVTCRKPMKDFKDGDRFLFLNTEDFMQAGQLSDDKLLRVFSYIDKTGRGERITLDCKGGAYIGQGTIEPNATKNVIFKGALEGDITEVIWFLDNRTNSAVAYTPSSRIRDFMKDINHGPGSWLGSVAYNRTVWFINGTDNPVRAEAYDAITLNRTAQQDIILGEGQWSGGVANDGVLWFINNRVRMAFAYNANSRVRMPSKDIDLGNGLWAGGLSDGFTLWFVNSSFNTAVSFKADTLQPFRQNVISLGSGIWTAGVSDGVTLWFVNAQSRIAVAYNALTLSADVSRNINLGTGSWTGACFIKQIMPPQIRNQHHLMQPVIFEEMTDIESIYKEGYNIDMLIRDGEHKQNWIFDNANSRIPVIISLDNQFEAPVLEVNGQDMRLVKYSTSNQLNVWHGTSIPPETKKIFIK